MATSLAKQLAQIAVKSKTTLNAKAQKAAHSKSLIWEPKIAATQSFQSLYPVCQEGFEELCGLDSRFAPFRATLFSEQSQSEERTQLTEAENVELDRKVEAFLRLAGSRLRLMPAIKAIEWLIRRFRSRAAKALLKATSIGREWRVDANGLCLAMIDRAAATSVLFKALLLLGTNLSEEVDASGSVRKELGTMLVQLSQDPGECGDIIQNAITDIDFDMDQLEMRLDLSLRQNKMLPAPEDDAMETSEAPVPVKETLSDELAKVSSLSDGLSSNLGADAGEAFPAVSEVFLRAIIDPTPEKVLEQFDSLPVLAREKALSEPTYISFYVRIWCGAFPALAKAKALEMVKNRLKTCNEKLDLQALIPYILAALSDPSKKVRQAAADLLIVVDQAYPSNTKGSGAAIWGEKSLYPGTQGRDAFSTEAAAKVIRTVLLPTLEECVIHQDHVSAIFESSIGPGKTKDSEEAKDRLPPPVRLAFARFTAAVIFRTPFLLVKERLLKALNRVRSIPSTSRTQLLLPSLNWWAGLTSEQVSELVKKERIDEASLNQRFVETVVANDAAGLQALLKIIVTSKDTREDFIETIFLRLRKLWSLMKPENKSSIANQMIDLALSASDADDMPRPTAIEAAELLRSVELTTDILSHFLESIHMETNIVVDSPLTRGAA
ncbi:unnamed protein product [Parascedosporium putredinis]|uniref:U3 small nucleolar RNA-associated protein 10 n=1 Tax=Parascedosporium putredinis TaxID=1442378 RepID=A0A9P1M7T8_9PEZI|nr:unnamed protein product [Parascedosporium putredinis]CAI7988592.1 unnamed protein product [Parascedosporium putredinis]